jgi:hypothetical protein
VLQFVGNTGPFTDAAAFTWDLITASACVQKVLFPVLSQVMGSAVAV